MGMTGLAMLRILANIKQPICVPRATIFNAPRQTKTKRLRQKLGLTESAMIKYVNNMFNKDGKLKFWQMQKLVLMCTVSTILCVGIYREGLEPLYNARLPYDKFFSWFNGDKTKEDDEQ